MTDLVLNINDNPHAHAQRKREIGSRIDDL